MFINICIENNRLLPYSTDNKQIDNEIIECASYFPFIVFIISELSKKHKLGIYKNIYLMILDRFLGDEKNNKFHTINHMLSTNYKNIRYITEPTNRTIYKLANDNYNNLSFIDLNEEQQEFIINIFGQKCVPYINNPFNFESSVIGYGEQILSYMNVALDKSTWYAAIRNCPKMIKHCPYEIDDKLTLFAFHKDPKIIKYINKTFEFCEMAIRRDPKNIQYITRDDCSNYCSWKYLCKMALDLNIKTYKLIENPPESVSVYVVKLNKNYFQHIKNKNKTKRVCYAAGKEHEYYLYD